jgi:hypothetical protein
MVFVREAVTLGFAKKAMETFLGFSLYRGCA